MHSVIRICTGSWASGGPYPVSQPSEAVGWTAIAQEQFEYSRRVMPLKPLDCLLSVMKTGCSQFVATDCIIFSFRRCKCPLRKRANRTGHTTTAATYLAPQTRQDRRTSEFAFEVLLWTSANCRRGQDCCYSQQYLDFAVRFLSQLSSNAGML